MPRQRIRRGNNLKIPSFSQAFTNFALSKPVGNVLDSSVGKGMVGVGNAVIKGAKKAKNLAKSLKGGTMTIQEDLFGSPAQDEKYRREGKKLNADYTLGSFKKGGKVKKTGKYKLHKGEVVVPAKKVKKMKKVMKSAKPGDLFNKFAKNKQYGNKIKKIT